VGSEMCIRDRSKAKVSKKSSKKGKAKKTDNLIRTKDLAVKFGKPASKIRAILRANEKFDDHKYTAYAWKPDSKELRRVEKLIEKDIASSAKNGRKARKGKTAKPSAKKVKGKKKGRAKSKKRDEEEEEEKPRRKARKRAVEEEDDEEEEKPRKRAKKTRKPKRARKEVEDDDEDEDDEPLF